MKPNKRVNRDILAYFSLCECLRHFIAKLQSTQNARYSGRYAWFTLGGFVKKILFLFLFLFVNSTVFGATVADNVTITEMSISKSYGDYVFIKVSAEPSRIACATNGYWHFTLPLSTETDKAIYSTLLSAYMSKSKIRIDGYSNAGCNEFGTIESMSGFTLK